MGLQFLLKRQAELKNSMKSMLTKAEAEGRLLSEEEETSFKSQKDELEKVKSQIALSGSVDLEDSAEPAQASTSLVAAGKAQSQQYPGGASPKKEFSSLDEFLGVVVSGRDDSRLQWKEYSSEGRMDTGSKGGFMVPTQFRDQILTKDPAAALVRPLATVIPAGSPADAEIQIPALDQEPTAGGTQQVYGGVQVYKVEEGGTKTATDFNLRSITLKPYEVAAYIPLTDKLLRNWGAASSFASNLLRKAVSGFEDTQFFTGNGVGGPSGIILSGATIAIQRAVANQIALADIKKIYARFRGDESKARWVTSYGGFEQLLSITGDGGGATNIISVDQSTNTVRIYGIPVVRHPRVPALGSIGDIGLYDFSEYLIKDGSGPIVEVGFATGQWEANKRSIKITYNVDGKHWMTKPYKDEANYQVSSSVVLGIP